MIWTRRHRLWPSLFSFFRMASTRAGLKTEGALYEAVSRGNKDTYFFDDDPEKAINPFENRHIRIPPNIQELRRIPPLNGAEFGRSCEFEFDTAGDVFLRPTILIDLPTWYPPTQANLNPSLLYTELGSTNTYGYTNGIGYFLFSNIKIYQDKLLLQEYSGDSLFALRAARGTLNSAYMENSLAGWHDGTAASIAANASPSRIRLELPFLGARSGFPSIAMRKQTFKLRLELRPLERLVESSDPTATLGAAPWGGSFVKLLLIGRSVPVELSEEQFGPGQPSVTLTIASGGTISVNTPVTVINSLDSTNSFTTTVVSYNTATGVLTLSAAATAIRGTFPTTAVVYSVMDITQQFTALQRTQIASPVLQLETRHSYVDGETQLALRSATLEIPFLRPYENNFVISPTEYDPITKGAVATITRRVDGQHPASRILWYSRAQNDLRTNRRWKFSPDVSGNEYYTSQSLIIAGRDRETSFSPYVWNLLEHHAKEDRDPGYGIGEMSWDLGDLRITPWDRQPEGTINFTTADRPTIYTSLSAVPNDTILGGPSTELTVIVDAWALYSIEKDRGYLKYGN